MGNFPNKETQFSSENQPEKNGRKKKIYNQIKEMGYSADDIRTAFGEVAWMTLPELKKIYEDDSRPVILRITCNQYYNALKKGDWQKISEILSHVIGKPKQVLDHQTKGDKIVYSEEEIQQMINEIKNSQFNSPGLPEDIPG